MYQEKRPTCVTVIGWVWIILGGLMFFSSIMALANWMVIGQMSQSDPEAMKHMPVIFKFFPFIAAVQAVIAVMGFASGIWFLKTKMWARNVLEALTWLMLTFILGFMLFWVFNWISMTSGHGPPGFGLMGAAMALVITAIYGVPLGVMLKYLRGGKVRNAMA